MTAKQHLKMAQAQIAYWKEQAAAARKALAKSARRPRSAKAARKVKAAPKSRRGRAR